MTDCRSTCGFESDWYPASVEQGSIPISTLVWLAACCGLRQSALPERGSVTRSPVDEAKRERMESKHVETVALLRLTEPRSASRPVRWWWRRVAP